jgi:adenylate cyclase
MSETRKIAAILVADVVGYSRLAGADEDRTLARLRALRSDLIDPQLPSITVGSSSAPAMAA